jgi:hypothetical protein
MKNTDFHNPISPASSIAKRLAPPDHPPTTTVDEWCVVVGWSGGRRAGGLVGEWKMGGENQ